MLKTNAIEKSNIVLTTSDFDNIEYYMTYNYQQPSIIFVRDKNGRLHCFSDWACKLILDYDILFEPSRFLNAFLKNVSNDVKVVF